MSRRRQALLVQSLLPPWTPGWNWRGRTLSRWVSKMFFIAPVTFAQVLNELHPEATFSLVEATGPSHSPQFCIRATLGQLQFEVDLGQCSWIYGVINLLPQG